MVHVLPRLIWQSGILHTKQARDIQHLEELLSSCGSRKLNTYALDALASQKFFNNYYEKDIQLTKVTRSTVNGLSAYIFEGVAVKSSTDTKVYAAETFDVYLNYNQAGTGHLQWTKVRYAQQNIQLHLRRRC